MDHRRKADGTACSIPCILHSTLDPLQSSQLARSFRDSPLLHREAGQGEQKGSHGSGQLDNRWGKTREVRAHQQQQLPALSCVPGMPGGEARQGAS